MNCRIEVSDTFLRRLKILSKRYRSLKDDLKRLEADLLENPYMGTDLGNHLHKIRLAVKSKGKGKSGGTRVITYTLTIVDDCVEVTLLTIYDKSDRENIPASELIEIMKANGL